MWAISGLQAEPLPKFELTNWDGRKVSADSLKGKTTILVFTYARCVFSCPMITFQLKELDEEMGRPPDLNFLHISVNPSLDTPQEIWKHFKKHDIDAKRDPRWLFLRGSETEVRSVLDDFGIQVKRTPVEDGVLIEHTIRVLIIDPTGRPVATFNTYQWEEKEMAYALRSISGKD
jgi:protein SCO1/2